MTTQSEQKIKEIPYLTSLIKPGEIMHVTKHMLPLDVDSPYGNLTLSWMNIITRINSINELITKTNLDFKKFIAWTKEEDPQKALIIATVDQNLSHRQKVNSEQLVYLLKTTADQIISLISILDYRRDNKKYPEKIPFDCIADILSKATVFNNNLKEYMPLLRNLNDSANCYKHSFINAQLSNHQPIEEPGVMIYHLRQNDLRKQPKIYSHRLRGIIIDYDKFMAESKGLIRN